MYREFFVGAVGIYLETAACGRKFQRRRFDLLDVAVYFFRNGQRVYAKHVFDGVDDLFQLRFVKLADDVACVATGKFVGIVLQNVLDVGY